MGYVLHNRLGSGGFVVEAMLELAGLDYVYEPIQSKPNTPIMPHIEHLNRWGQVPVLETADGKVLTEVAAIICYLAQQEEACADGPHLWLNDYAACLRWSVFMSVNIYEGILRQTYPHRYFDSEAVVDPAVKASMVRSVEISAEKRVHQAFLLLEEVIDDGGFLFGPKMSACDVYLAMLYSWHEKRPILSKCGEITRRVATHRLIQPLWVRNFGDDPGEKWHESGRLWSD